MLRIINHI